MKREFLQNFNVYFVDVLKKICFSKNSLPSGVVADDPPTDFAEIGSNSCVWSNWPQLNKKPLVLPKSRENQRF